MKRTVIALGIITIVLFISLIPLALNYTNIGFVGDGSFEGDWNGDDVAILGDVNGDSYDDILIAGEENMFYDGRAYLVLGRASGWSIDSKLKDVSTVFYPELSGELIGRVAAAGDVNGDGFNDMLFSGKYKNEKTGNNTPRTYLFFGKATDWPKTMNMSLADVFLPAGRGNHIDGQMIAGGGDVNGDGFDDILISNSAAPNPFDLDMGYSGCTYLIFGKADPWEKEIYPTSVSASFLGTGPDEESGYSLSIPGDVNRDGFDDILIGAPFRNSEGNNFIFESGQVNLILGRKSGWSQNMSLKNSDASFIGAWKQHCVGDTVAGAGDVNRDGYDDMLIGTFLGNKTTSGWMAYPQVYLVFGKAYGWLNNTSVIDSDVIFYSEWKYDRAGRGLAGRSDVNGDGYDDIMIGAPGGGDSWAGKAYLFYGRAAGWNRHMAMKDADVIYDGEYIMDNLGGSISGGGDVNGDGREDFIIGADDRRPRGETYVIMSGIKKVAIDWVFYSFLLSTFLLAVALMIRGIKGDRRKLDDTRKKQQQRIYQGRKR